MFEESDTHTPLQFLDEFVYELSRKETNAEKRRKLGDLTLTEEEWDRVRLFCNLLQVSILTRFLHRNI